jgi:hypothetical protein
MTAQECAISNLLSQKRDIKRQQGLVAKMEGEHAAERELALEKARERVLEDFERAQANGSGKRTPAASGAAPSTSKGLTTVAGVKRKFEVDTDEVERLIKEAEDRALKQLEAEQVRASFTRFECALPVRAHRKLVNRRDCPTTGCHRSHRKRRPRSWPTSSCKRCAKPRSRRIR